MVDRRPLMSLSSTQLSELVVLRSQQGVLWMVVKYPEIQASLNWLIMLSYMRKVPKEEIVRIGAREKLLVNSGSPSEHVIWKTREGN